MARYARGRGKKNGRRLKVGVILALILAAGSVYLLFGPGGLWPSGGRPKPIILYINQGNGVVNGSGFGSMLDYASSRGFNTVFFQVYRQGSLLFSPSTLQSFVNQTHLAGLRIFFALYITSEAQALPVSVFGLEEDGVSLDMSSVSLEAQQLFLAELEADFVGKTAVTTTNMSSTLKPDLLVLETYGTNLRGYIRSGIVASVGVYTIVPPSIEDYQSQFQYALQDSDGVMVFDYAGLLKAGY